MLLEGRVAFLTGAGSGIGRAGALALAREGARVTVTDLDGTRARAVAEEIQADGGEAEALALDAADDAAVLAAIDAVAARGRLDILHSHAGIQVQGRLTDINPEGMDASWRLNVRAHFIAARAAMPHMQRQRKGSIIITASNSGVQYDRGMIAYCTTKHAVVAMTRQIAVDYARRQHSLQCPLPRLCRYAVQSGLRSADGRTRGAGNLCCALHSDGTLGFGR